MSENIVQALNQLIELLSQPYIICIASGIGLSALGFKSRHDIRENYKLKKYHESKGKIHNIPQNVIEECNNLNLSNINSRFEEIVLDFVKVLESNLKPELLNNMNRNLNELKIKENLFESIKMGFAGLYSSDNTITLRSDRIDPQNRSVINHELLHLSSTSQKENVICGFDFNDGGRGINEGCTEYLNIKLFNCNPNTTAYLYKYLANVAHAVEVIIGEDKLYETYFNSNPLGLVTELSNYSNLDDISTLIRNLDYIYYQFIDKKLIYNYKFDTNVFKNVNDTLISMYKNKLLQNNDLDQEKLNEFVQLLPKRFDKFMFHANIQTQEQKNIESVNRTL